MSATGFPNWVKRWGVLAVVLAALTFAVGGRAEAAEHDHHAMDHAQAEHAHTQHAVADHDTADHKGTDHKGINHSGGCHCMSAACTLALPVAVPDYYVWMPRSRHAVPGALAALALAGVDPPAEPPRL